MVEFDDVLAMDASDDWDGYAAAGGTPVDGGSAAVAASGRVRGARIRLIGELPEDLLHLLQDLVTAPSGVLAAGGSEGPGVGSSTGGPGRFEGHDDELDVDVVLDLDTTRSVDQLADSVVASVLDRLRDLDRTQVHLEAAVVAIDGDPRRGALLLHPERAVRHHLVGELAGRGAALLGADDVILVPGTRTVFGTPVPVRGVAGTVPLSTLGLLLDHAVIERVVIIDTGGGEAGVEAIEPAHAIADWLISSPDLIDRHGPGAVDPIVAATAAASFTRVRADSVDGYVEAILGATSASCSPDVLLHRFDLAAAGEGRAAAGGAQASLRVARIGDAGVLVDGRTGLVTALEAPEIDALEALATAEPVRGRSSPAADVGRHLDRVRGSDVDLSIINGRRSSHDARSLPNSQRATASSPRSATTPAALEVLAEVAERCASIGVRPIVLGAMVLAHDSTAPARAVEVDSVDVLLAKDELEHVVEVLVESGYLVVGGPADGDGTDDLVRVALRSPARQADGEHREPSIAINIQAQLPVGHFSELVDLDAVRRRSIPVLVGDLWCDTLHPVDRFVLACSQAAQRGGGVRRSREVVLTAPRLEPVMTEALEASDRWGATRDVLAAVRDADRDLPGISPWLVDRSTRYDTARRSRRARRRR